MLAAPHVTAQYNGTCLPKRREDSSAIMPTPFFMLIGHFCGSRVTVPSGHTVNGRPEVRMPTEVSSMARALPLRRSTGCMPTSWNHLPISGHEAISALAM